MTSGTKTYLLRCRQVNAQENVAEGAGPKLPNLLEPGAAHNHSLAWAVARRFTHRRRLSPCPVGHFTCIVASRSRRRSSSQRPPPLREAPPKPGGWSNPDQPGSWSKRRPREVHGAPGRRPGTRAQGHKDVEDIGRKDPVGCDACHYTARLPCTRVGGRPSAPGSLGSTASAHGHRARDA